MVLAFDGEAQLAIDLTKAHKCPEKMSNIERLEKPIFGGDPRHYSEEQLRGQQRSRNSCSLGAPSLEESPIGSSAA